MLIRKLYISKILWSSIEDYVGLWELVWELNSSGLSDSRSLVDSILKYLLKEKLIKLYYSKWGKDELLEIDNEHVSSLLLDSKYWEAPSLDQLCIKVGSTIKGEEYYENNRIEDILL